MLKKREEELREKRHASRKDRKVTLDFAGRRVVESDEVVDMYDVNDSVIQTVHYGKNGDDKTWEPIFTDEDFEGLVNPRIPVEAPKVPTLTLL